MVNLPGSSSPALLLALALSTTAACAPADDAPAPQSGAERADELFEGGTQYITGAFDGSKRFGMWTATMEFARKIERDFGKPLHFTYFINTCYYDHTTVGSDIGRSHSVEEDVVRMALTQQAVNEGHEIASHAVRHEDGSNWTKEQWRNEFNDFDKVISVGLFEPIVDSQGQPVFPRWQATASGDQTGASCSSDAECSSGECLMVAPEQGFCTQGCNGNLTCPNNTFCGAPDWNTSQDRCIPMPAFPVVHNGQELFDKSGTPNLSHPDLQPYRMIGFRAPLLGRNAAMFDVLDEFGFRYDTSDIVSGGVRAPYRARSGGRTFPNLFQFGLMKNTGSRTVPMDYNYKVNEGSGERMLSDYKRSIVDAYNVHGRVPWNIGHHFALWKGGAYWQAMQDTFIFAAQGCPDEAGALQCENVEFPSFAELSTHITGLGRDDEQSDDNTDPFDYEVEESDESLDDIMCTCGEEDAH